MSIHDVLQAVRAQVQDAALLHEIDQVLQREPVGWMNEHGYTISARGYRDFGHKDAYNIPLYR